MTDNNDRSHWAVMLAGGFITLVIEFGVVIWWAASVTTTVNNLSTRLQGVEAVASLNSVDKMASAVTIAKIEQSNIDILRALAEDKRTLEAIENYLHDGANESRR